MDIAFHPVPPISETAGLPKPGGSFTTICSNAVYTGRRLPDGTCQVLVQALPKTGDLNTVSASGRPLPLRTDIRNHSPTGFAWGYGGSGPAQLALALLLDALADDDLALQHYQQFKWQHVVKWGDDWQITAEEIRAFVARQ